MRSVCSVVSVLILVVFIKVNTEGLEANTTSYQDLPGITQDRVSPNSSIVHSLNRLRFLNQFNNLTTVENSSVATYRYSFSSIDISTGNQSSSYSSDNNEPFPNDMSDELGNQSSSRCCFWCWTAPIIGFYGIASIGAFIVPILIIYISIKHYREAMHLQDIATHVPPIPVPNVTFPSLPNIPDISQMNHDQINDLIRLYLSAMANNSSSNSSFR